MSSAPSGDRFITVFVLLLLPLALGCPAAALWLPR